MGMPLEDYISLSKEVKRARKFLGLSVQEVSFLLGVSEDEVKHLEQYAILEQPNKDETV